MVFFRDGSCRVTSAYAPEIFKDKSRFYKTIGDKKVYGKFSEVGKRLTVNKSGTYTGKLESLTQEELIVSITADPDNGKYILQSREVQIILLFQAGAGTISFPQQVHQAR